MCIAFAIRIHIRISPCAFTRRDRTDCWCTRRQGVATIIYYHRQGWWCICGSRTCYGCTSIYRICKYFILDSVCKYPILCIAFTIRIHICIRPCAFTRRDRADRWGTRRQGVATIIYYHRQSWWRIRCGRTSYGCTRIHRICKCFILDGVGKHPILCIAFTICIHIRICPCAFTGRDRTDRWYTRCQCVATIINYHRQCRWSIRGSRTSYGCTRIYRICKSFILDRVGEYPILCIAFAIRIHICISPCAFTHRDRTDRWCTRRQGVATIINNHRQCRWGIRGSRTSYGCTRIYRICKSFILDGVRKYPILSIAFTISVNIGIGPRAFTGWNWTDCWGTRCQGVAAIIYYHR